MPDCYNLPTVLTHRDKLPLDRTAIGYAQAETRYLLDIAALCLGRFGYRPEFNCGNRPNAISRANAGD